jgi:hypothetical protein
MRRFPECIDAPHVASSHDSAINNHDYNDDTKKNLVISSILGLFRTNT